MKTIKNIYQYREMIINLVHRDLRGRYRGSALGFVWTFLNPLFQLLIYTIVFSQILRNGIQDYYVFLFVALIPWIFFGTCISEGCGCIRAQSNLVAKIYFPREVIPISYVTSQFINMILSLIVVLIVCLISGHIPTISGLATLPLVLIIEYLMALGFVYFFSGITVYFRDIQYILGIISMAWQFLTPVMYAIEMVPQELQSIFRVNPMVPVITAYREILYQNQVPSIRSLGGVFGYALIILAIGHFSFQKLEPHFAENL